MISKADTTRIEGACRAIGNDLSDPEGFVSLERLLLRFNATLVMRPLLVEGMVAAVDAASSDGRQGSRWVVLIDSESFPSISDVDLVKERFGKPLPARFRNTV